MRVDGQYTKLQQKRIVGNLFRDRERIWLEKHSGSTIEQKIKDSEYPDWRSKHNVFFEEALKWIEEGIKDRVLFLRLAGFYFNLNENRIEKEVEERGLLRFWSPDADQEFQEKLLEVQNLRSSESQPEKQAAE